MFFKFKSTFILKKISRDDNDEIFIVDASMFINQILEILNAEHDQLINLNLTTEAASLLLSTNSISRRYFLEPGKLYSNVRDTMNFEWLNLQLQRDQMSSEASRLNGTIERLVFLVVHLEHNDIQYLMTNPDPAKIWEFLLKIQRYIDMSEVIYLKLENALNRWKMFQKTAQPDPVYRDADGLRQIGNLFKNFASVLLSIKNYLCCLANTGYIEKVHELMNRQSNLFRKLIFESFLFENQPPQVLRTNTK